MKRAQTALLLLVPLLAYILLSGYGIDRGYPTALYALTVAIVEDGSLSVDRQRDLLGYDKAVYQGRLYSDKAPGPSLLMILPYLAARRLTANPDLRFTLTILLGMILPAATAPLGVRLLLTRCGVEEPNLCAWGFAFASLYFPYATVGISDPMTATAVAWSYALSMGGARSGQGASLILGGMLAGFALLTRYQAVLLLAPLAIALILSLRKASLRFLIPIVLAAILLLSYNLTAFGHPLHFSTQHWQGKEGAAPTLRLEWPSWERAYAMTFGMRRGLFLFTPLLLLVPLGTLDLARRSWRTAAIVIAALGIYFGFLLCNRGWIGGADFGMRFSVDALPLVWLLACAGQGRLAARLWRVLAVPSVAIALLGALTGPYVPFTEQRPIIYKARDLLSHGPRTIFDRAPRTPQ